MSDPKVMLEVVGNELGRLIKLFEQDIDENQEICDYIITAQETTEMFVQLEEYPSAVRELRACRDRIMSFLGLRS